MNVQPRTFDQSKVIPVKFAPDCGCNTTNEDLLAQINQNIRRGLPQVCPHEKNNEIALLVCGGPSLEQTKRDLVEEVWAGRKIIAVNGAYQWCIDNNLKPSAAIMLDAREFNARFVETPVEGCKYLLASQCHPKAFEHCRDRETFIWHAIGTGSDEELALLDAYYFKREHHWPVTIGVTVGIRAISLLRMLGFQMIDIFGLDSCWMDGRNHGYEQPENDADGCIPVWLTMGERRNRFLCAPWHVKQAEDFRTLLKERGDHFQLSVRGPGLIATMMRTGAEIQTEGA